MTLSERIDALLEHTKKNPRTFAKSIGAKTPQAIYDLKAGKTKTISPSMICKISSYIPDLNIEWLLTGTGSMLRPSLPDGTSLVSGRDNNINSNVVNGGTSDVAAEVEKLRAENALLRQIVKEKERIIEEKERTISLLMQSR